MPAVPSGAAGEALARARELHRRGDLAAAIEAYAHAVAADASLAEAWRLKALAEQQAGMLAQAWDSAERALQAGGEEPATLLMAGTILHDRGELERAEGHLARLAAASPEWAPAQLALGEVRMDRGRPAEALESFRAAAAAQPANARAWNNAGIALLALDRPGEAREFFERALQCDPRHALASFNLARIYARVDRARALAQAQDAVRADPALADAWLLIGELQRRDGETAAAFQAINTAIERAPQRPDGWDAHASLMSDLGEVAAAQREFAAVAQRFPSDLRSAIGARLLLPRIYESGGHLEESRARYAAGLDELYESAGNFRFGTPEAALTAVRWTNFYLAYQGRNDRALQARYAAFQRRVVEPAAPDFFAPLARPAPRERIRVGFFSHYFYNCVVGRYFASWITRLDRSRFETFVYYTNEWMADDSRAIAAASDAFRQLAGRPLAAIARQVREDALDILVYPEVGMHHDTVTFSGLRLAPVQCAAWGHPTTTGSPEIDWFLSCESMEPPHAQDAYSERLALLPGLGTHYALPQSEGRGTRAEFGLPEGRTLYLFPQSLFKIHPDNDALVAQVLARDDQATLVMFESAQAPLTRAYVERLGRALQAAGASIERVHFLKPNLQHAAYLRLNQVCDVMLDTLHWSGGNASLDALASALPIVTLPGALMRGRQSQAMLRALGLEELVVAGAAEYVDLALQLGRDPQRRRGIADRIEQGRERLFARDEPIRALESFLERAARG